MRSRVRAGANSLEPSRELQDWVAVATSGPLSSVPEAAKPPRLLSSAFQRLCVLPAGRRAAVPSPLTD